ncbi:hypothetical protein MPLDJ20_190096 [Mesorhizobium plurifarium]|uniref:Uncharacterized protein n=1 Tax=Mesorhizobium plurifarium TaxID=69974 RepID=A0A090ET19_MESPL|nr:hypothetical protein MPLDJ20_190096 [Mesorhizobium plurifarium]
MASGSAGWRKYWVSSVKQMTPLSSPATMGVTKFTFPPEEARNSAYSFMRRFHLLRKQGLQKYFEAAV